MLSGGLDSSTALALAIDGGFKVTALTFDYGQRHRRELESAKRVARHFNVKDHLILRVDLGRHVRSSLTTGSMRVPTRKTLKGVGSKIPSTYVPSRNIVFLSIAASIAESRGAGTVFIAANSVDFSGYPDCTPEFIKEFQRMLDVGTKAGREGRSVKIETPLLRMSKAEIVREAVRLRVPLELTWSCYRGGVRPCGRCESCLLRRQGFMEAGYDDPLGPVRR